MIDLPAGELAEICRILQRLVPDCEVRAFGSRVGGAAQRFSDLDLALVGEQAISPTMLGQLKDAFSASDLSISVDVVDWNTLETGFREAVGDEFEVIQGG